MLTPIDFTHSFTAKMSEWAGWQFTPGRDRFLYEHLKGVAKDELEATAKKLVATHAKRPSQAEIIAAASKPVNVTVGIANITYKPKDYKPYPQKFIREVVQESLEYYAHSKDAAGWKEAYAAKKAAWEAQYGPVEDFPTDWRDERFGENYFGRIQQSMVSELVHKFDRRRKASA